MGGGINHDGGSGKVRQFESEGEFVRWLTRQAASRASGLALGIGDDAALVQPRRGAQLALTTDLSLEGIHFSRGFHPPEAVGRRALARSLSDLAAMGAAPRFVLLSCGLPRYVQREWIGPFFRGFLRLARRFQVDVVGGDTARGSARIVIDVVAVGEVPRGSKALLRTGARPGDSIFVGGTLGLSALGLRLLRSREAERTGAAARAIRAHLNPQPQCALGSFLAKRRLATSAIDVSDGLSSDLIRLCDASGVGARVFAERIPSPAPFDRWPPRRMLSLALNGGEDYSLLFTASPAAVRKLPSSFRGVKLHQIGMITSVLSRTLVDRAGNEEPILACGWDHFRQGHA